MSPPDPGMIIGICPTQEAVVIIPTSGSGGTFALKSITAVEFQARSGEDLKSLWRGLAVELGRRGGKRPVTIALLASSAGRFKSALESIKAEVVIELVAAELGLEVIKVTAASLKKALDCAPGEKWQARSEKRFNPKGRHKNWSKGAAGAAAAAFKVAGTAGHPRSAL